MRGKRGQFFLLAAVIISSVIISLGASMNMAIVNEEPKNFYALSEEAQREIAAFLDYALFTNDDEELGDFLVLLAENMEEIDPSIDFAFIYRGSGNKLIVENYGSRDFYVNDTLIEKRAQTSITTIENSITRTYYVDEPVKKVQIVMGGADYFLVKIEEDNEGVVFPFLDDQQVVLVTQKEERGDVYVSIG